ncbi:HesA/MoeB/ThiF family protein [Motilibacter peucedani]|nr:ThiF family adenylyltransferase [Motilibacter peucedani]
MLKSVSAVAADSRVLLYVRPYERVTLADPDGSTTALLSLLAEGSRTLDELATAVQERGFAVTRDDVAEGVAGLAELGVLQEPTDWASLPVDEQQRHESNLRYYELFATPTMSAVDVHRRIRGARVLLLGAGGAGSGILQALVGAGVGFVRLVDVDVVETKNLARQFCYGSREIGRSKVAAAADWVGGYSTGTLVEPLHERIEGADRVAELAADVDVVVCAIDTPSDVQLTVNQACMRLRIPLVTGGLQQSTLYYWSVQPGVSPCRQCLELHRRDELAGSEAVLAQPPLLLASTVNRATGAVVQLLAGQMALEVMRYLGRHDEPVAAATYQWVALADGMSTGRDPWTRHAECGLCAAALDARAGRELVGAAG